MSEHWKKHDRPCPPCTNCGAELYEKFWGGGEIDNDPASDAYCVTAPDGGRVSEDPRCMHQPKTAVGGT